MTETAGDTDDARSYQTNNTVRGIGEVRHQRIIHARKCRITLPADHQVAVVRWSGKETESSANDLLSLR
jgi:hypothetical protein